MVGFSRLSAAPPSRRLPDAGVRRRRFPAVAGTNYYTEITVNEKTQNGHGGVERSCTSTGCCTGQLDRWSGAGLLTYSCDRHEGGGRYVGFGQRFSFAPSMADW